jgi:hypothetical protein
MKGMLILGFDILLTYDAIAEFGCHMPQLRQEEVQLWSPPVEP